MRLVWLEIFIELDETENLSAVALKRGIHQSTVSRYMQDLQNWLGRELIDIGKINDPDDPGRSIAITEDGREFLPIAQSIVDQLNGFRSEESVRKELIRECRKMVTTMRSNLSHPVKRKVALLIESNIVQLEILIDAFDNSTPIDLLKSIRDALRRLYQRYESELARAKRKRAPKVQAVDVDDEWFDGQRRQT